MPLKTVTLRPIKIHPRDFDEVEEKLKKLFRDEIYFPLMDELWVPKKVLTNAADGLADALRSGRITFSRGTFSGKFNLGISRELKALGAVWDSKTSSFKIQFGKLPLEIQNLVSATEFRFKEVLARIDRKLAQMLPNEIADKISIAKNFDQTLWKTDQDFQSSIKGITIAPKLTDAQRKKIADEWQNNMKLWVKDFTEKQIVELRQKMQKTVFAGNRYESAIKTIQKSYGVSENKAKFLARQETNLLMTKFKQTRYEDAGVKGYKWGRVSGTPAHPVRPQHKKLAEASDKGKIYYWNDPPISTEPNQPVRRNNPGQDYNCRCFARPVVTFRK